jgi:two-component system phosphate regulon sensor histidine kinase PhoR
LNNMLRIVSEQTDQVQEDRELMLQHPTNMTVSVTVARLGPSDDIAVILQDRTELRRLETVRRDFVANVSHELRTPLTSVKAMAETLMDGALHDESVAKRFLKTIVTDTDRLVRLTADLLALSRIESYEVEKVPVDLVALIRDIMSRLRSSIKASGLTLDVRMPRACFVDCSEDEIGQVMLNLLENAIKYSLDGGKITISVEDGQEEVLVAVADTGIGILQQDIPRIFERFYRADKARSRASGGTGLGLSIVKHIVERHGGRVWVESVYNHGSCFHFALPKEMESTDESPFGSMAPKA